MAFMSFFWVLRSENVPTVAYENQCSIPWAETAESYNRPRHRFWEWFLQEPERDQAASLHSEISVRAR